MLREVLLGLLDDDPTLEPRDVLVMCPDIETYAPLIEAGFGLGDVVGSTGHPAHRLRVRLADRAPGQTNPLLGVALALLDLAGGRALATQVLDLARTEPVRRRFGFGDDDLDQLDTWAREAGVRWAFDAEHRADFGLAAYVANTWRVRARPPADRRRPVRRLVGLARPSPSARRRRAARRSTSSGRLAEYVDRLRDATDRLTGTRPLDHWLAALDDAVASLTSVSTGDGWQSGQVQRELGRVRHAAAGLGQRRPPAARRPGPAHRPAGGPAHPGQLPHRHPHRLHDGADALGAAPGGLPARSRRRRVPAPGCRRRRRRARPRPTDRRARRAQRGPPAAARRDPGRESDPGGHLHRRQRGVRASAPARRTARRAARRPRRHLRDDRRRSGLRGGHGAPSPAALRPRERLARRPAARCDVLLRPRGGCAVPGPRPARAWRPSPSSTLRCPRAGSATCRWPTWCASGATPCKGFLARDGVDVALAADEEQPEDALPVELDSLAQWAVGDRVLARPARRPRDRGVVKQREWRRGELPPGQLGWRMLGRILDRGHAAARRGRRPAHRAVPAPSTSTVDLGDGRRLRGTVPEVYGDRLVSVTYSRLGPKHRLASWVRLLALVASDEDRSWTAHTIGRPTAAPATTRRRRCSARSTTPPTSACATWWSCATAACAQPLPLPLKASFGYARARRTQADVSDALVKAGYDWKDGTVPRRAVRGRRGRGLGAQRRAARRARQTGRG